MEHPIKKAEKRIGLYVLGGIVLLIAVFFAGTKFAANSSANTQSTRTGGNGTRIFTRGGNGAIIGTVLKKDDQSITVQTQDGSTKIVFVGSSTNVYKTVSGSLTDIPVGGQVVVQGTTNSDGSVTGQNIQVRNNQNNPQNQTQSTSQ